jgi:hypothetical protein
LPAAEPGAAASSPSLATRIGAFALTGPACAPVESLAVCSPPVDPPEGAF